VALQFPPPPLEFVSHFYGLFHIVPLIFLYLGSVNKIRFMLHVITDIKVCNILLDMGL
jgi:hypothetical protein